MTYYTDKKYPSLRLTEEEKKLIKEQMANRYLEIERRAFLSETIGTPAFDPPPVRLSLEMYSEKIADLWNLDAGENKMTTNSMEHAIKVGEFNVQVAHKKNPLLEVSFYVEKRQTVVSPPHGRPKTVDPVIYCRLSGYVKERTAWAGKSPQDILNVRRGMSTAFNRALDSTGIVEQRKEQARKGFRYWLEDNAEALDDLEERLLTSLVQRGTA